MMVGQLKMLLVNCKDLYWESHWVKKAEMREALPVTCKLVMLMIKLRVYHW